MNTNLFYTICILLGIATWGCSRKADVKIHIEKQEGLTVVFFVTSSSDTEKEEVDWVWDMSQAENGLDDQRTGRAVSYTYPRAGSYFVRVTGRTAEGKTFKGLLQFNVCPDTILLSHTVNCTNAKISVVNPAGFPQNFLIDYGDQSGLEIGTGVFEHNYPDANAIYEVRVYGQGVDCDTMLLGSIAVAIKIQPNPLFEYGRVGTEVEFLNQSTGSFDRFVWIFGDHQSSTEVNPTHDFVPKDSLYNITLFAIGDECTQSEDATFKIQIPPPSAAFVTPYSKTNLFHSLNTIPVKKYVYGNYEVMGDESPLYGFPHREHLDVMSSFPEFQWQQFDDPQHVMVVISKNRIIVNDGGIVNVDDLIWAWNEGMSYSLRNVRYDEGRPMAEGKILYDKEPEPLQSGDIYYWCVYGWNADLSNISFSSKEFPFKVQ